MLSREEKRNLRSDLFRHLDGIVIAPTMDTLEKQGVLQYLLKQKEVELQNYVQPSKPMKGI